MVTVYLAESAGSAGHGECLVEPICRLVSPTTGRCRVTVHGANNPHVVDLFQNGQFLKRADVGQPGWIKELSAANNAATSQISWIMYPTNQNLTDANFFMLVKASNQWWSLAQLSAAAAQLRAAGTNATNAASILGGTGTYLGVGDATMVGGRSLSDQQVLIAAQTGANWRTPFLDPNCNASYNGCR